MHLNLSYDSIFIGICFNFCRHNLESVLIWSQSHFKFLYFVEGFLQKDENFKHLIYHFLIGGTNILDAQGHHVVVVVANINHKYNLFRLARGINIQLHNEYMSLNGNNSNLDKLSSGLSVSEKNRYSYNRSCYNRYNQHTYNFFYDYNIRELSCILGLINDILFYKIFHYFLCCLNLLKQLFLGALRYPTSRGSSTTSW